MSLVYFVIASALGATLRFWFERMSVHRFGEAKPWGTLAANLIGSLLLGWSIANVSDENQLQVLASFTGAFTTFGGFIGQTFQRLRHHGSRSFATTYLLITVIGSIAAALIGLNYF